jgi:glycosyltransferase involved in cell wall biosynthesis
VRPLRIAMVGQRGVPATFGGIEHHVEELGSRLVERGHEVIVYARPNYLESPIEEYRGMRVKVLPTVDSKHLDAIVHSGVSTAAAIRERVDVIHYHAIGPGIPGALPRFASHAKVALTVHGRDGERAKWGRAARMVLSTAEWMSAKVPDATIVVSQDLQRHYLDAYGRQTWYIPNGVEPKDRLPAREITDRWGLTEGSYVLFVGRLVPEKAPDLLIHAFRHLEGDVRLVIAGGSSFTDEYVGSLEALASTDDRVVMAGYVYGDTLTELYSNASVFVLPSALEGLPLTLLEAASFGSPLVASDIPPHLEIVSEDAPGHRVFTSGSEDGLIAAIERARADGPAERTAAEAFREDVLQRYRWDRVVDETEHVYDTIVGGKRRRRG